MDVCGIRDFCEVSKSNLCKMSKSNISEVSKSDKSEVSSIDFSDVSTSDFCGRSTSDFSEVCFSDLSEVSKSDFSWQERVCVLLLMTWVVGSVWFLWLFFGRIGTSLKEVEEIVESINKNYGWIVNPEV